MLSVSVDGWKERQGLSASLRDAQIKEIKARWTDSHLAAVSFSHKLTKEIVFISHHQLDTIKVVSIM